MEKNHSECCFLICKSCKYIEFPGCSHGILNYYGECPAAKCHFSTHQYWQICSSCKSERAYVMDSGCFFHEIIQFAKEMMILMRKEKASTVLMQCKGCASTGFVRNLDDTGLHSPCFVNGYDNFPYRHFYNWTIDKNFHRDGCSKKDFWIKYCILSMEEAKFLANNVSPVPLSRDTALVHYHPSTMPSYAPNAMAMTAAASTGARRLSDVLGVVSVIDTTNSIGFLGIDLTFGFFDNNHIIPIHNVGLVVKGVAAMLDELLRSFQSVAARRESTKEDINHLGKNMATFVSFVESGQLTAAENATARNDIRVQWTTILRSNRDRKFGEWEWNQLNGLYTVLISKGIRVEPLPPYKTSILKSMKRIFSY
mmetsp:Transcript_19250/g.27557  ORF Transcript_19250/g.27557 Transcript_19250/m.27557 type:complete len:367 (-) Transcript_19250:15-1115(-)